MSIVYLEYFGFVVTNIVVPLSGLIIALVLIWIFLRSQSFDIKAGAFRLSAINRDGDNLKDSGESDVQVSSNRQYALFKEYHAQGLAQSKISFWFSLLFAALGFLIIIVAVGAYLFSPPFAEGSGATSEIDKPIFALVAGTVIEAVAALFFVQSNKARQLMIDFFEKARRDRKLDEALSLTSQIANPDIAGKLKSYLAINFAEIKPDHEILLKIFGEDKPWLETNGADHAKTPEVLLAKEALDVSGEIRKRKPKAVEAPPAKQLLND